MSIKSYKSYKDIPKKYKFDLEDILKGQDIEKLMKEYFDILNILVEKKDSQYNDLESFVEAIKLNEKASLLGNKISNYISNNINTNVVDSKFNTLNQKFQIELFKISEKNGSEENRIFKHETKIKEWLKDERLKDYRKDYEFIFESKKHKLSDEIEDFITKTQKGDISAEEIFSIVESGEIDYGFAEDSNGKKYKITRANRIQLLQSSDEKLRKSTYLNWNKGYLKHKESFANMLFQHFKNISTWAKIRNYNSSVESIISSDKADEKLLEILYTEVKNAIPTFRRYQSHRKIFFKKQFNKKMEHWDTMLPLVKVKNQYSIEESNKYVLEALKPFNSEYYGVVKKAFNENWIDYVATENKRSGAYSIGESYGLDKKYILMNFDGSLRSVSTIAHEMGHSLHSYYSDTYQPLELSSYPIFLAEIASIFNELMLQDYLLNKKDISEKFKFHIISESIGDFEGTVRRQTMWSEFEYKFYQAMDNNLPISTYDSISELYAQVTDPYRLSKEKIKLSKDGMDTIASVIVPHFYYHFYVYKYAIGYIAANAFFQKYKKEGKAALEQYINEFLKKGSSDWPIQILKNAGIDLYDPAIYKDAFNILKEKVDMYIKLGNKIWK